MASNGDGTSSSMRMPVAGSSFVEVGNIDSLMGTNGSSNLEENMVCWMNRTRVGTVAFLADLAKVVVGTIDALVTNPHDVLVARIANCSVGGLGRSRSSSRRNYNHFWLGFDLLGDLDCWHERFDRFNFRWRNGWGNNNLFLGFDEELERTNL